MAGRCFCFIYMGTTNTTEPSSSSSFSLPKHVTSSPPFPSTLSLTLFLPSLPNFPPLPFFLHTLLSFSLSFPFALPRLPLSSLIYYYITFLSTHIFSSSSSSSSSARANPRLPCSDYFPLLHRHYFPLLITPSRTTVVVCDLRGALCSLTLD